MKESYCLGRSFFVPKKEQKSERVEENENTIKKFPLKIALSINRGWSF
jgi:hypothetical protein